MHFNNYYSPRPNIFMTATLILQLETIYMVDWAVKYTVDYLTNQSTVCEIVK